MPRTKRTRKQPIVSSVNAAPTLSHRATQETISKFHTLLKRKSVVERQLERNRCGPSSLLQDLQGELRQLKSEIEDLGGLEAYQHASTLGQSSQRGGDSSKVLVKWLKEMGVDGPTSSPLRLLEIGALKHDNYASCSKWISNTPIDLRSNHPDIVEQDFLTRPLPTVEEDQFDVISCSLVVNFVPDIVDRGELWELKDALLIRRGRMLQLCRQHLKPSPSSLFFVVLPLPCVSNSRFMTAESFQQLLTAVGFELLRKQWKPRGKVAYWLFRWAPNQSTEVGQWTSKRLVNDGPGRNNFSILLPSGS